MEGQWEVPPEEARAGYEAMVERDYVREWNAQAPWMAGMIPAALLGFAAWLVGGFLHQIWQTTGADGDGLLDTAVWFLWAGRALVGAAFVLAAIRPSPATPAVRLVLIALGTVVLLGSGIGGVLVGLGL